MRITLHKNATTTPAIRAAIQRASGSDYELAREFRVTRETIRRWRKRDFVEDASHTAHHLPTTLNAGQEELVIYLRTQLRLPLDDLLAVIREFIEPTMSRSALGRLLRRRGHSRLPQPEKPAKPAKPFKAYLPGYFHVDVKYLPQMADETSRRYAFVAIDRATRWVFVQLKRHKNAASARSFLGALAKKTPVKIHKILTDNGKEFTDRIFGQEAKSATGSHEFDALCQALGIEHRLTKRRSPRTNGMVERFNERLAQLLRTHRFENSMDLETTIHRYVALYNEHLPQKSLDHLTPLQALKNWQDSHPQFFQGVVRNRTEPDNYVPPLSPEEREYVETEARRKYVPAH